MPLIVYTGELGKQPPQHRVVEMDFRYNELLVLAGSFRSRIPFEARRNDEQKHVAYLLAELGRLFVNHYMSQLWSDAPRSGLIVREADGTNALSIVEAAVLLVNDPTAQCTYYRVDAENAAQFDAHILQYQPDILIGPNAQSTSAAQQTAPLS